MARQTYRDKVLEVLHEARSVLVEPGSWTQGTYARNRFGRSVSSFEPDAVSWCAVGAVHRAAGNDPSFSPEQSAVCDGAIGALADAVGPWESDPEGRVTAENDEEGTTVVDVLRWFDAAIAATERDAARASAVAAFVLGELGKAAALAVNVAVFHATGGRS